MREEASFFAAFWRWLRSEKARSAESGGQADKSTPVVNEGASGGETDPCENKTDFPIWTKGRMIADQYRVDRLLGRGGFGVVYLAWDLAAQQPVAIKVPHYFWRQDEKGNSHLVCFSDDEPAKQLLFSEVQAWMSLAHPHVVEALDIHDDQSTDYLPVICMKYCNGGSLAERIRQRKRGLPLCEGLDIAIQVCWALEYIHSQHILHRDLKAANVLLVDEGPGGGLRALVSDLGLAKLTALPQRVDPAQLGGPGSSGWGTVSVVAGTCTHMAPELWEVGKPIGPEADIYAFGVLLYEIFCRRPPFLPNHLIFSIDQLHREGARPDPRRWRRELPEALSQLMIQCLAPEPKDRPTLAQVEETLRQVFSQLADYDYGNVRQKPTPSELTVMGCRQRAWARLRMGLGAGRRGDYAEAEKEFREAEALFDKADDVYGRAAAMGNRALILGCTGALTEALNLLDQVENQWRKLKDRANVGRCLANKALIYAKRGQLPEAIELLRRGRMLLRKSREWAHVAVCSTMLTSFLLALGERRKARQVFRRAVRLARRVRQHDILSRLYGDQAAALLAMGLSREALSLLHLQAKLCAAIGDRPGLASCYGAQAVVYKQQGQLDKALELHRLEQRVARIINDQTTLVRSLLNEGGILLMKGEAEASLEPLGRAEVLGREIGLMQEVVGSLINQAIALALLNRRLPLAQEKLDEAEAICRTCHLRQLIDKVANGRKVVEKIKAST